MATDYLRGIFHWRDYAGQLDASHPPASLNTLLWGCNRWLEENPDAADTADGRRIIEIKHELEDWLARLAPSAGDTSS